MITNEQPVEEKDLVKKASSGDIEALNELLSRYNSRIHRSLAKSRLNHSDIEDIIQNSAVKVMRNIANFTNTSSFFTWYYAIARNEMIDHIRKAKKTLMKETSLSSFSEENDQWQDHLESTRIDKDDDKDIPDAKICHSEKMEEIQEKIQSTVAELSESHRKIFELVFVQQKSYEQAAKELSVPMGTVMSRVFYTRKKLKEAIKID